eukprot:CAMPEP_0197000478 /NCGR_PEP_ID=MMETSP1380-20130617/5413_1 /TAXON_ID=5936 /ORGANISM="Euplotes crassus, Strain CT5" /LENGTH=109 /DNA_ID=CAMNT_0042417785 /DNA_START=266 /DNA_END=592 /DNA_ORIENTATION=+
MHTFTNKQRQNLPMPKIYKKLQNLKNTESSSQIIIQSNDLRPLPKNPHQLSQHQPVHLKILKAENQENKVGENRRNDEGMVKEEDLRSTPGASLSVDENIRARPVNVSE